MKIDKAEIEELKKKFGQIYEGEIAFTDADDKPHLVEFIFREPKTVDVEANLKSAQAVGVITSNMNLIQSLVVYPEAAKIIEDIRPYPNACGRFIETVIQPFFGGNATATKKKL
jgi:hypothetical protein